MSVTTQIYSLIKSSAGDVDINPSVAIFSNTNLNKPYVVYFRPTRDSERDLQNKGIESYTYNIIVWSNSYEQSENIAVKIEEAILKAKFSGYGFVQSTLVSQSDEVQKDKGEVVLYGNNLIFLIKVC